MIDCTHAACVQVLFCPIVLTMLNKPHAIVVVRVVCIEHALNWRLRLPKAYTGFVWPAGHCGIGQMVYASMLLLTD